MPYIEYVPKSFADRTLAVIAAARSIIAEYLEAGYRLTLRQLYYQFVARDLIPNTQKDYNRLGRIVSDARLAGMVDWNAIEDRTRNLRTMAHWESPAEILDTSARQFRVARWDRQPVWVEVWIEKEALAGVFDRVCAELDVPLFSCRGYNSQSEMWAAGRRLARRVLEHGHDRVVVLHFGDHDPSGIDMTRDIEDRLGMFMTGNEGSHARELEVRRVALNMDQVEEHDPPPNPAKVTDSRWEGYVLDYGHDSWELDALEPAILEGLVRDHIEELMDPELWEEAEEEEEDGRRTLRELAAQLRDGGEESGP